MVDKSSRRRGGGGYKSEEATRPMRMRRRILGPGTPEPQMIRNDHAAKKNKQQTI